MPLFGRRSPTPSEASSAPSVTSEAPSDSGKRSWRDRLFRRRSQDRSGTDRSGTDATGHNQGQSLDSERLQSLLPYHPRDRTTRPSWMASERRPREESRTYDTFSRGSEYPPTPSTGRSDDSRFIDSRDYSYGGESDRYPPPAAQPTYTQPTAPSTQPTTYTYPTNAQPAQSTYPTPPTTPTTQANNPMEPTFTQSMLTEEEKRDLMSYSRMEFTKDGDTIIRIAAVEGNQTFKLKTGEVIEYTYTAPTDATGGRGQARLTFRPNGDGNRDASTAPTQTQFTNPSNQPYTQPTTPTDTYTTRDTSDPRRYPAQNRPPYRTETAGTDPYADTRDSSRVRFSDPETYTSDPRERDRDSRPTETSRGDTLFDWLTQGETDLSHPELNEGVNDRLGQFLDLRGAVRNRVPNMAPELVDSHAQWLMDARDEADDTDPSGADIDSIIREWETEITSRDSRNTLNDRVDLTRVLGERGGPELSSYRDGETGDLLSFLTRNETDLRDPRERDEADRRLSGLLGKMTDVEERVGRGEFVDFTRSTIDATREVDMEELSWRR